ncbi:MAG: glycosyltransferase [bacterium]|nr:glycosyltransferase [bacterium]
MNSPKKILVAAVHPWDSQFLKAGNHHYIELLAKNGHKIFWINHPTSIPHLFREHGGTQLKNLLKGVHETNGVLSYTPFTLFPYIRIPPFNSSWVGKQHLRFAIPSVKKVLESHGFADVDILFMDNMSLSYLTEVVKYKKFVLRIVDDFDGLTPAKKSLLDLQKELIKKADAVFVTSKELMKYNVSNRKNFWYLPNAVDLEHFEGEFPLPEEYKNIPSPRILYVGSLFQWIDRVDINLILKMAQALPSYNFIFVGPATISLDEMTKRSNIFLLGPKKYEDIPAYMKHADVGIIPFKQNTLTKAMSSMKLFQYLASGLPVVSSRMPELESMNPPAYFAKNQEEFIAALQKACQQGKNRPEFFAFAKENSWANRYKSMTDILGI